MKPQVPLALAVATLALDQAQPPQKPVALFDGRSFAGGPAGDGRVAYGHVAVTGL